MAFMWERDFCGMTILGFLVFSARNISSTGRKGQLAGNAGVPGKSTDQMVFGCGAAAL
jgi:hypothetical protein